MYTYNTLVEAIDDLKQRGYTYDFNLGADRVSCPALELELHPEQFSVEEVYRFEGMSNPDDNAVVYAIAGHDGVRGVLVDAYGPYAEALTPEMARKLH